MTSVDDAGRGDARPAIIKGRVFPLRERVSVRDVECALHGLAAKGCVSLYTVDGKPYFWFPTWTEHQRIRDSRPKYPSPEESDDSPRAAASCGQPPPAAACIQSESNPKPEERAERGESGAPPPVAALPLNDGTEYPITEAQAGEWAGLYPAVDVHQQLRAMRGWLLANPRKRKTQSGILRFVNAWLAKEQDRGAGEPPAPPRRKLE